MLGYFLNNDGECPDISTPPCQRACFFIYKPVCSYSSTLEIYQEFPNQCALDVYLCQHAQEGMTVMLRP